MLSSTAALAKQEAAPTTHTCFHCGLPILAEVDHAVLIDGQRQPMCCQGCEAVASAIVAAGLSDFYRHRTTRSRRVEDLVPEQLRKLALYDRPDLQKSFVRIESEQIREAALMLEGIVCAACIWLNERHVGCLPGVLEFHINYSSHRARLRWDDSQIRLSEILAAITAIGYVAHPFDPRRQEALQKRERAVALRRLAVAGLGSMQVMMLAIALYAGDYQGMEEWIRTFLRWTCLILTAPVAVYSAWPFYRAAWRDLRHQQLGMDVPVSVAIMAAFVASAWYTWQGGGEVYYDSVTMFVFFLLAGRFLEMNARHEAGQMSEALVRMLPATATRLMADGSQQTVAVSELNPGDQVLVRPGETIPADGRVEEGVSSVDESLLTGESLPLVRHPGSAVIGGALNVESPLVIVIENVGPDTVLSAIVRLLDRAQSEKPALALLADRIAAWFIMALLLVATLVLGGWWWSTDFDTAFRITLAVLVVTCPCALSLATPTALVAATGALTRLGLLATRGHALETLARATHIIFDKTGTLTYGRLQVRRIIPVGALAATDCLALAAALERGSEHPVGRALVEAAGVAAVALKATDVCNTPGSGIEGVINGRRLRVGRPEFVLASTQLQQELLDCDQSSNRVALADDSGVLAWFELADRLRSGAATAIADLKKRGLTVQLFSGDRPAAVDYIAHEVAIPTAEGAMSPQAKLERLRQLQNQGKVIAMVGDGVNDAPVLAAAQVSLAMGSGTQLAHATADMILLSERLEHLASGVDMARKTLAIMRENFAWAIGYNLIALPLAASGYLTPWMSAIGMSFSSLLVVLNALRLRRA
jgi:Cu2+-exporting ATPase